STFNDGQGRIRRLFENYPAVEQEYFSRTGIFPIMHVIAMRRDVYQRSPWIAQSLLKAFTRAKALACDQLSDSGALYCMLPWLGRHLDETRRLMGSDFWPYGLDRNTRTLETFLRYSFEQGLSKRQLKPEEIFAPESLETFKV
ncbi:MAG: ABC transporter substrate-binding protein, partial [Acidobacteriota bacterium]|nr:ABC transporter substrate-binding protein [Acidobacteriota bacterium]